VYKRQADKYHLLRRGVIAAVNHDDGPSMSGLNVSQNGAY